jgi:hypothetical protein
MINEIKLKENGTICLVEAKEEIKGEIEIEEHPLAGDRGTVIFELLPLEITFDDDVKVSSIFEMVNKYPALKQLHKSVCTMTDLYLARMWKDMEKEFSNKSPFQYILFQKVVSTTIAKLKGEKVETFFLTEPLMFGILKGEKPSRIEPIQLLRCLATPVKIYKHLASKNLPPYEDGLKFLELITSAFKLNSFMNESLNPF